MSDIELKTSDILALDRTRLAAERTLMAWVRTAQIGRASCRERV